MTDDTTLPVLPATFATTTAHLHQLAFFVLAPHRYDHEARLGLRAAPGGFGTPWFPTPDGRRRVRMIADLLVVEGDQGERSLRPTTLGEACSFLDMPYREVWFEDFHDPPIPIGADAPLELDGRAASALGAWFAFATQVLEAVRSLPEAVDASQVQLWPEHFDPATEIGHEASGRRASYGASPGDAAHPAPYLFVSPWGDPTPDTFWNDDAFGGASCGYHDLRAAADPSAEAQAFLHHALVVLTR